MILLSRALSRESTLASVLERGILHDNIGRIAQVRWSKAKSNLHGGVNFAQGRIERIAQVRWSEAKPNLHGGVEFNRERIAQVRWSKAKPNLRGGVKGNK